MMQYRKLGKSGLMVSVISLGSWRTYGQSVDETATAECMQAAYDSGINFFDGAEGYGAGAAELAMGRVFRQTGWSRDSFCVSSKVFHGGGKPTQRGLSRKHIVDACDAALQRMGLDYLDLYFCHRPDPDTPLDEIVYAMNELILRGKVMYWGTSNFCAADLLQMSAIAERDGLRAPTMEQPCYNMLSRQAVERELAPVFERYGLGTTVYSPLATGILTGKYNDGIPEDSAAAHNEAMRKRLSADLIERLRALAGIAEEQELTPAQLALAWCLKNPNVSTVITGASHPRQVGENVAAADMLDRLSAPVMERIADLLD